MAETAYELLALGLRYWFVLLIILTLLRSVWLMRGDQREYRRMLRHLPDAGLVGEVVDLASGASQPLPREGIIGGGHGCDIRFNGLRRREMEFVFRPGLGLKLIPLHTRHGAALDGEALGKGAAYALHGTVLELRGRQLRFRLFAGLDLPERAISYVQPEEAVVSEPVADVLSQYPDPLPPPSPPQGSLEMTWQYAPLPQSLPPVRNRRAGAYREGQDE